MNPISVIIPSYRNPLFLDLCLQSAFDGQENDNQIIVVLDGFPEESMEIVNKYKGLNVVVLPENKGQIYAHNIGVINATNERILIVNDDNVFGVDWDVRL